MTLVRIPADRPGIKYPRVSLFDVVGYGETIRMPAVS